MTANKVWASSSIFPVRLYAYPAISDTSIGAISDIRAKSDVGSTAEVKHCLLSVVLGTGSLFSVVMEP